MELPDFKALWLEWKERPWKTMTLPGLIICLAGCGLLAIPNGRTPFGAYPLLHHLTIVPHEGGHMIVHGFFNIVAPISGGADEKPSHFPRLIPLSISAAGTIGQLLVVVCPAFYFLWKRSATPLGFFIFCAFGSFIGIGIYMMDCRVFTLDYVSYGEVDYDNIASLHDWAVIFGLLRWNLGACETIGKYARWMGWTGMAGTALWLPWMYYRLNTAAPARAMAGGLSTAPEVRAPGGSEALLLIEKDPQARQRLASLLRRKGYAVLEAATLEEAMRKMTARPAHPVADRAFFRSGPEGPADRRHAPRRLAGVEGSAVDGGGRPGRRSSSHSRRRLPAPAVRREPAGLENSRGARSARLHRLQRQLENSSRRHKAKV